MDRFCVEGKFQWGKIWMVPLVIMLAGTLVLAIAFRGELPSDVKRPAVPEKAAGNVSR